MPLCSLHLVELERKSDTESVFAARRRFMYNLLTNPKLKETNNQILLACVIRRSVIVATRIDHVQLNKTGWDLLLVLKGKEGQSSKLSSNSSLQSQIKSEYSLQIGIPSRLLEAYKQRTKELNGEANQTQPISIESIQQNPSRSVEQYSPKTSQNLEHSPDLEQLIKDLDNLAQSDGLCDGHGPVQQLNLLSFNKSKQDQERYYEYGKGFTKAAKPFGGEPKILAKVIDDENDLQWQEVSLVNYHSISHFAAMAASETYQSINREFRLPSLDDTTIICTQEIDLEGLRSRIQVPQLQANL